MNDKKKEVKIFTMEKQFPCGQKSSCCGPVGQSEQEVLALKSAIEELGLEVEVLDVRNAENLQKNPRVSKLFSTFGPQVIPVIMAADEVVCMGRSFGVEEIISAIESRL